MEATPLTTPRSRVEHPTRTVEPPTRPARSWPLERVLFLLAGTMTALSAILSAFVSPWFLLLTGFVALNQLAFVAFGDCPSSWLLRNHFGFKRAGQR